MASGFLVAQNSINVDQVIVTTSSAMHCLRTSDGQQVWSVDLPGSDSVRRWHVQASDTSYVAVGISPGMRVTTVAVSKEGLVRQHRNIPAPWISEASSCEIMEDRQHFVCYSPQTESLQLLSINNGQAFMPTYLKEIGVEMSDGSHIEGVVPELGSTILFRSKPDTLVLMSRTSAQTFNVYKTLDKTYAAKVIVHAEKPIVLSLGRFDAETLQLNGQDLNTQTDISEITLKIPFAHYHGSPQKMFPFLFSKKKDSSNRPGLKLIFAAEDYSVHFVQKNKAHWRREEAMAYILSVQMVDLPVSVDQAKFEEEFGTKDESLPTMFIKRLQAQVSQVKQFVQRVIRQLQAPSLHHYNNYDAIEEEVPTEMDLVRDDFNLHKIIVVATTPGKVYGIRSHTGKIAWQQFVPNLGPFVKQGEEKLVLVVQRTTAHFPHDPRCTVLGVSRESGNGLVVSLNPLTGALLPGLSVKGLDLGYKVIQAEMLAVMDSEFLKGIVLIDENLQPHIHPASSLSAVKDAGMDMFFHIMNSESGFMTGYKLAANRKSGIAIDQVWNVDLQKSQQTVTGVYKKRAIEHVHSQGRVLGDRSVLYKYLNPNVVAVVTEGEEQPATSGKGSSTFFSIYLIDSVTGHMVYHQTHKRARGPVNVIHSENWVVYSYFNDRHRRNEMAVLEMYEGKEQSNSTAFSSFSPPNPPLVLRQSYIFPEPAYAMEATVTEKGITSKNIIVALKIGGILSLPKALLDPRRPVIPTQETMEEGTIPYVPEIGLSTEALVNYNRSVFSVQGVHTSPAGLESTSLVFVYGIDIFYTRVMPSRMFDVLKEDFDYLFIGGVLALMIFVSFLTQKLASRKALSRAWK